MFILIHDIDYVIAAICIVAVIYFSTGKKYTNLSGPNKAFYRLTLPVVFGCIFDIALNIAQTYPNVIPTTFALVFRFMYNAFFGLLVLLVYQYVRAYQVDSKEHKMSFFDWIEGIIFGGIVLFGVVNFFTGWLLYFDENGVAHDGPLFNLNIVLPIIGLLILILSLITHKKKYNEQQFTSIIMFGAITVICAVVELLLSSRVLLAMFGSALAYGIIQLSLETPDYSKLMSALEQAERSAKEAENARDIAEKHKEEADKARIAAEASFAEAEEARERAIEAQQAAEEAKENAARANATKSDFLARMSHEIRTPMNAIMGMNAMIMSESTDPAVLSYAKDVEQASKNLLGIINDILDFSKIESGKMTLVEDTYSLGKLLHEEESLLIFKAREKNLKLVFEVDEEIPDKLVGDDVRIKQVLTNLLTNAIKYTDSGTVSLKVTLEAKGRSSVLLKFVVKDTGRGIKEEDIGKLYDAFERIEEKRNRDIEGSGLGINIVSHLLTMMGSKLMVDSVYGLGSKFYFSLRQTVSDFSPISSKGDEQPKIESAGPLKPLIHAPKAKVMVVDDNTMNLKVFEGLLKATDMQIATVTSGKDSIRLAQETRFDIIFMDHLMPEMDGLEAREKIVEGGLNKDTPIVALTANAIKGAEEAYISNGFSAVAFKPSTQKELNEILWRFIPKELIDNK